MTAKEILRMAGSTTPKSTTVQPVNTGRQVCSNLLAKRS